MPSAARLISRRKSDIWSIAVKFWIRRVKRDRLTVETEFRILGRTGNFVEFPFALDVLMPSILCDTLYERWRERTWHGGATA